jgi:4a-hydroxytetrahydrobiopterin dehydratase
MSVATIEQLREKSCQPCEGKVPAVSHAEAERMLQELEGWKLMESRKSIRREWVVKDFQAGLDFLNEVGGLAEEEGHHPDLHLTGYKQVAIELSTHAIGGLSENDFILAAKINALPVRRKGE